MMKRKTGELHGELRMNVSIRPLTSLIGAEIVGIDLGKPIDEEAWSRLYGCFADRAVLMFRDQDFDPPRFAAAAQLFGEIIPEQSCDAPICVAMSASIHCTKPLVR